MYCILSNEVVTTLDGMEWIGWMNVNDLISCPDRDPWKNGLRPGLKR